MRSSAVVFLALLACAAADGTYYEIIPNVQLEKKLAFLDGKVILAGKYDCGKNRKGLVSNFSVLSALKKGRGLYIKEAIGCGYLCIKQGAPAICKEPGAVWKIGRAGVHKTPQEVRSGGKCLKADPYGLRLEKCTGHPSQLFFFSRYEISVPVKSLCHKKPTGEKAKDVPNSPSEIPPDPVHSKLTIPGARGKTNLSALAKLPKEKRPTPFFLRNARRLSYAHAVLDRETEDHIPPELYEDNKDTPEDVQQRPKITLPPELLDDAEMDPKYDRVLRRIHRNCAQLSKHIREEAKDSEGFLEEKNADAAYHYLQKQFPPAKIRSIDLHGIPAMHEYNPSTCYANPRCGYGRHHGKAVYNHHWNHD